MPILVAPIKCDFFKWAKFETWTLYQTACILSGVEPVSKSEYLYEDTSNILDTLAKAIEADALQPLGNYHGDVKFYPLEAITWAKSIGMKIPEEISVIAPICSEMRPVGDPPVTENAKKRALLAIKSLKKSLTLILSPQPAKQQSALPPASQNTGASPLSGSEEHWQHFPGDPPPAQTWYTPARYYARHLISKDSTLIFKRNRLSERIAFELSEQEICKRGGKKPLNPDTILKALVNVDLTKTLELSPEILAKK